jgi:hypothetical protein
MTFLASYMPRGEKVRTLEYARECCESLGFPIVSKAPFGSSSHTVRALHNASEAMEEATQVLGHGKLYPGLGLQEGECLWQEFLPGNTAALRVAIVQRGPATYGWAFWVQNRVNDWRASGSGLCIPLSATEWASSRIRYAVNTALSAADLMQSRWCAFDLLWARRENRWRIVDTTLAWNMSRKLLGGNYDAPVYNLATMRPHPKGLTGANQWDILLDSLVAADDQGRL